MDYKISPYILYYHKLYMALQYHHTLSIFTKALYGP